MVYQSCADVTVTIAVRPYFVGALKVIQVDRILVITWKLLLTLL